MEVGQPDQPWMKWFTASIRQGVTWLKHAYTSQANMFGSFTTSALNSFTNQINSIEPLLEQKSSLASFSFFSV